MKNYDIIIIGTGQATGTILPKLLEMELKVAVVEGDRTGGSCVNWGCTPTKALVASARNAHMVRRSEDFGLHVPDFTVDFPAVMDRMNAIRNTASEGFTAWLEEGTDYYRSFGRFVDDHTIEVGDETIRGDEIIIHTGARARKLEIPGMDSVPWLDNKRLLSLTELPEHLLILGGSYIGLEFAQIFRRFGSKVTIIEHEYSLISREDSDVSKRAKAILESEGITVILGSSVSKVEEKPDGTITLSYLQGKAEKQIEGSHLLVGVGRIPNSDNLDLQKAGVKTNEGGYIIVDDSGRTNVPHIFALGDVTGKGAFTHTSVHDGQVYLSALAGETRKISDRIPIYCLYMDPPLARVGLSEGEARKKGVPFLVTKMQMSAISRAKEKGETKGFIKILVSAEDESILGASVFGVGGDEIIGMFALAMEAKISYRHFQNTVLPHPTVAELIPFMFANLSEGKDA
jgi:pyruvate/2-oxoglutarate dehydrogenase complex dihydrolipoamide dehydrogenase (E3) component